MGPRDAGNLTPPPPPIPPPPPGRVCTGNRLHNWLMFDAARCFDGVSRNPDHVVPQFGLCNTLVCCTALCRVPAVASSGEKKTAGDRFAITAAPWLST